MRLFLGIPATAGTYQIDRYMMAADASHGKPIALHKAHITMLFIGDVAQHRRGQLLQFIEAAASVIASSPSFSVTLDTPALFQGARVGVLCPSAPPTPMLQLHSELRSAAVQSGFAMRREDFRPHLTLFKSAGKAPPVGKVTLPVRSVGLYQVIRAHGSPTIYHPRHLFSLQHGRLGAACN